MMSGQLHALPLYTWVKSPYYSLDRRLGEPQKWSGGCRAEKKLLPVTENEPTPQPFAIITAGSSSNNNNKNNN
jgi:hypothetical protein